MLTINFNSTLTCVLLNGTTKIYHVNPKGIHRIQYNHYRLPSLYRHNYYLQKKKNLNDLPRQLDDTAIKTQKKIFNVTFYTIFKSKTK